MRRCDDAKILFYYVIYSKRCDSCLLRLRGSAWLFRPPRPDRAQVHIGQRTMWNITTFSSNLNPAIIRSQKIYFGHKIFESGTHSDLIESRRLRNFIANAAWSLNARQNEDTSTASYMVWQFKFVMQVMISTYIGRYKYLKKSNSGKMLRQSFSSQDQEWRTLRKDASAEFLKSRPGMAYICRDEWFTSTRTECADERCAACHRKNTWPDDVWSRNLKQTKRKILAGWHQILDLACLGRCSSSMEF